MSEEEETDQYLIHSDVFSSSESEDKTNDGRLLKNSVQFLILSNENDGKITVDDDGDLDSSRPERIDLNLGIVLVSFYSQEKDQIGGLFD